MSQNSVEDRERRLQLIEHNAKRYPRVDSEDVLFLLIQHDVLFQHLNSILDNLSGDPEEAIHNAMRYLGRA
jgi:hypothetical protein